MGCEMEVQAEVPVGHWKARLRRAERAREDRWYWDLAASKPGGVGESASWMAKAGLKDNIAEEFPCASLFASWYSRRKTSPAAPLAAFFCPSSSSLVSNPQYSPKNISPSSSLIFLTLTGFDPASILAAISCRLCITCGSGRCAGGGKAAPLLCALAEMAWEERRSSEGGRAKRK